MENIDPLIFYWQIMEQGEKQVFKIYSIWTFLSIAALVHDIIFPDDFDRLFFYQLLSLKLVYFIRAVDNLKFVT